MKFIKKNKYTVIVIVCFILLVFIGAKAMELFFPNTGKAIYGDRLNGIEAVKIKDSKMDQALGELKQDEIITSAKEETKGRLVTFIITVNDETSLETAKTLADKAIGSFEDKQKSYYDFQIIVKKKNEELKDFPIIGYKHHDNNGFVWTKDRAGSAE